MLAVVGLLLIIQQMLTFGIFTTHFNSSFSIQHRRFLSFTAFFAFFNNILVGMVAFVVRALLSVTLQIIFMSRIDMPIHCNTFQPSDISYSVYSSWILTENFLTNPCLLTFTHIMNDVLEKQRVWKAPSSVKWIKTSSPMATMSVRQNQTEPIEKSELDGDIMLKVLVSHMTHLSF